MGEVWQTKLVKMPEKELVILKKKFEEIEPRGHIQEGKQKVDDDHSHLRDAIQPRTRKADHRGGEL